MEDLYYGGGIPAVLRQLLPLLHGDALTVTGRTLAENVAAAQIENEDVIRTLENPLHPEGGLTVLRGNLAPEGAIIKHAAATERLLQHRARAVVFRNLGDMRARLDDPALDIDPDDVLVLQNVGPVGGPGMPEVGNFPIPQRLLKQGVRDMLRISDARMSGTAFGTVVLHVAPESAAGGPLALVRDGDEIELDLAGRRLQLHVDDEELARRRRDWQPPPLAFARGYGRLY
jgi:dihydroxy-acid dehydratase